MTDFNATFRAETDNAVIDLTGTLDRDAEERFDEAFAGALIASHGAIVLNFTDIGLINSTGIALVVAVLARGRAAKREIRAYGLDDHYRHIFEITRLADFIGIYDDEPAALDPREEHHHA